MSPLRNKVSLIGFVTSTQDTVNGKIQFILTTKDTRRTDEGKWIDEPNDHIIHVSGPLVRRMQLVQKDQELVIEGRLVNDIYRTSRGTLRGGNVVELNDFFIISPPKG